MKVWAVHRLKDVDVSQASTYGELEYINTRYVYADEIVDTKVPDKVRLRIERAVDVFDPDHDYVLIAGDHLQLVLLSAMLAARWGHYKVLRFDREAGGYFPVTIDIGEDNGHVGV